MKVFTKKSILQKIIISILVILLLINFITPTYSNASAADVGGVLLSPIIDLLCSIGDVVINLLQRCMMGDWGSSSVNFSLNMFLVEAEEYFNSFDSQGSKDEANEIINPDEEFTKGWLWNSGDYYIPVATYSPEQIFSGNVAGLDINFLNPNTYTDSDGKEVKSSAKILQPTIASWYVALRNLAVVGLLSILVYVGIRIIISSTASDKAKYKQMFMDWLVALCLLFFLHYIMSFVITLTESICSAIAGDGQTNYIIYDETQDKSFSTNLLGAARYKTQYKDLGLKLTYLIFYLALVIYTCVFTYFYLKRLLMMAFLTLIAPLVALTYPIDKMNDGKAQAFDTWLKEYVFNALIQPFHLIIYTVFVTSAMDLVNLGGIGMIYAIAALGFILPAEKILRNFFGFSKAGAGTLGALGTVGLASMAGKALKGIGGGKGSGSKSQGGNTSSEGEKPVRFESKHDINDIDAGAGENTTTRENNNNTLGDTENNQFSEDERMAEIEGEDYNFTSNPEWMALNEQREIERARREQEQRQELGQGQGQEQEQEQSQPQNDTAQNRTRVGTGLRNLARYHNITPGNIAKGTGRAIKGVAKFGTRTAFKAGTGALAAAVTAATGGGLGGSIAAFATGSAVGARLGEGAINLAGAATRAPQTIKNTIDREVDAYNGNTERQKAATMKEFKKDENNMQYVKDMMTKESGGIVPSNTEVKARMNELDPYLAEGLTDIKDMLKAQKAEGYGITAKQSAIIAAIGKEKGINADILNDKKKLDSRMANMKQEFMNKGKSESEATKLTEHTFNVLKAQNGVAHSLRKTNNRSTNNRN